MFQGISLTQAPPLKVVLAFFLNAHIFLALAGILGLLNFAIPTLSLPQFALIHCLTLGFLLSMIFGAITQMLPVLAGVYFSRPWVLCVAVLTTLDFGIFALFSSFIWSNHFALFLHAALGFLGACVLGFVGYVFLKIKAISHFTPTIYYFFFALFALGVTAVLGLMLGAGFLRDFGFDREAVFRAHIAFASTGFLLFLIIGVCLQVLPMFYVAPAFSRKFYGIFVPLCFAFLVASFAFLSAFYVVLGILFFGVGAVCLRTLKNRKRKLQEVSMNFWNLGFCALVFSGVCSLAHGILSAFDVSNYIILELVRFSFAFGFVFSIIFAMFFKIVPFLSWFHLSFAGVVNLPNMREIITQKFQKIHFILFILTLLILLFEFLLGKIFVANFGFIALGIFGIFCISRAIRIYDFTLKTSPKMEFNF